MDRAIEFYEDFLELPIHKRDEILSVFLIHGFRLCLFENQKVGEKVTYGDNCLLSLEVDNIDRLIQKLEKLNAQIVFPLTKIASNWVLEFKDTEWLSGICRGKPTYRGQEANRR